MTKKIISLILSITLISSSLTAFAAQNDVNITLNNEPDTDFAYDISNADLKTINNVDEIVLDMPVSINDESDVIDLENDNIEFQAYTASGNDVDVNEKSTLTAEDINGTEDDEDIEEDDGHKKLPTAKTSGEIRVADTESYSSRAVTTAPDTQNRLNNINFKDSYSLQNQTGRTSYVGDNIGEEYVDPLTGNLIVTENDLTLPGVDGFGLKLERYYSCCYRKCV